MLMKEINLGFHKKKAICFDTKAAMNQHILLLGKSGSGKSTEAQKIILELSRQQRTVLIFDIHSVAAEEQIFSAFRDGFKAKSHEINAYRDGISCNLFQPLVFADGESEKQPDAVEAVVNMLSRTVKLGSKQRIILRKALFSVINNGSYVANGFASIDFALSEFGTADAESVREKLYPLTAHNIFREGDLFIQKEKINLIRLNRFDLETQAVVTELVLSYVWRLAVSSKFRDDGLFIFVDEFLNLPLAKGCAIDQILAEGRKFNINLILTAQQLDLRPSSAAQQWLMQSGLILLFQPGMTQAHTLAKLIGQDAVKEWTKTLSELECGEFIAVGDLTVDGIPIKKPLRISSKTDRAN